MRVKQALSAAKTRAHKWDSQAVYCGFTFNFEDQTILDTGRAKGWKFLFYTRRNCEPGKVRTAVVSVFANTTNNPTAEEVNGFGVACLESGDVVAPLPAKVDDDWMDSDRAFAAVKKAGLTKVTQIKAVEVKWYFGKSLWKIFGVDETIYLDFSGKVAAKGDDIEMDLIRKFSKPAKIEDAADRVRNDWASWKNPGGIKITSMSAVALAAAEFVKDPRVHRATFQVIVEKPVWRRYRLRVINDRADWFEPCTEVDVKKSHYDEAVPWPFDKIGKLKESLAAHEELKAWRAKFPAGFVDVKTLDGGKLQIEFLADEKLLLQYDSATGKLE